MLCPGLRHAPSNPIKAKMSKEFQRISFLAVFENAKNLRCKFADPVDPHSHRDLGNHSLIYPFTLQSVLLGTQVVDVALPANAPRYGINWGRNDFSVRSYVTKFLMTACRVRGQNPLQLQRS